MLVGGTAIALQLGYRSSIDFNLASLNKLNINKLPRAKSPRYSRPLGSTSLFTASLHPWTESPRFLRSLNKIVEKIKAKSQIIQTLVDEANELRAYGCCKFSKTYFFHYLFSITPEKQLKNIINMPGLLTLTSMKAYALGRRAKKK